jgi:uncharacterized protein YjbJ (UPF0337 family)
MISQQTLRGNWHEVRGKLKAKWGTLSDDDLGAFNGDVEQLVGRIQRKTGETREVIERFLDQITEEGFGVAAAARDKIEQASDRAAEAAREGYETLRTGYTEAERVVRERPGQAIAVAFALGLLSGLSLALLLHERAPASKFARRRDAVDNFGKQLRDILADVVPESLAKRFG